jgi:hypothetical protein
MWMMVFRVSQLWGKGLLGNPKEAISRGATAGPAVKDRRHLPLKRLNLHRVRLRQPELEMPGPPMFRKTLIS